MTVLSAFTPRKGVFRGVKADEEARAIAPRRCSDCRASRVPSFLFPGIWKNVTIFLDAGVLGHYSTNIPVSVAAPVPCFANPRHESHCVDERVGFVKIPRPCPYWVVSRCLALLLFIAAGLKLYGLRVEAVASMGVFAAPQIQLAVVILEISLGLWLLSGKAPDGSWLVALFTFSAFAAVSLWLASIGRSSCGCFGRLAVSPWYAFAIDVVVLAALTLSRPDFSSPPPNKPTSHRSQWFDPRAQGCRWNTFDCLCPSGDHPVIVWLRPGRARVFQGRAHLHRAALGGCR